MVQVELIKNTILAEGVGAIKCTPPSVSFDNIFEVFEN